MRGTVNCNAMNNSRLGQQFGVPIKGEEKKTRKKVELSKQRLIEQQKKRMCIVAISRTKEYRSLFTTLNCLVT